MGKPKIRFKGYEDDWEQRKFADMAIRESAVQTASQEIPGVEYDDVVVEEGCLNKDISSKETKKSGILFDGSQVLYGKLRPYLHNWLNPDFKGVAVGDWWVLKPIDLNKNFLYRLIQTQQFDNIANQSAGSKMPRADWNLISNSAFMVPFPNEEQRKIGDYFLSLDHLITLHQRKCYRFIDIALDAWEQRKLGDNIIEYHEVTTENNQYPVLTSSRKGIFLQTEYYSGNQVASSDNTGYNVVPYGYFTYRHMSDDQIFYFNINDIVENGIVSTLYPVFTTNIKIDSRYLQYQLNYGREFAKFAILQKQGGSRTYMYLNKLKSLCLTMPKTIGEQKKISEYFMKLDHLITLHQRKCEETKSLKKYMLKKMFPENGKCVPEIRFSGFSDDWEQRKLGDVLVSLQNNTLSRADLSKETGVAKNVHYGDVLIKYGEVLDVSKAKLPMISDESILTKYRTSFLQNGDVIVADTAEDSTVGKCSEIAGLIDEVVLSGLHTIPYRPVEKFASGYLGYYLNSNAYHHQLIPLMQGIKVTSISKSAMQDTGIIYPKLIEEQAKIGTYFQSLDHLITLHQHKCDELQKLKKFMLQNMFM